MLKDLLDVSVLLISIDSDLLDLVGNNRTLYTKGNFSIAQS